MTDQDQQSLEVGCIDPANFIKQAGQTAMFWKDTAELIGASNGEQTTFVYAECNLATGIVHGRPISRDELRRLGVSV